MSAGPVGIGDRIGRTDRDIVMRTCDADGRLRHIGPRARARSTAACSAQPAARRAAGVGHDVDDEAGGRTWTYVVAINTATDRRTVADRLDLDEIGLTDAHALRLAAPSADRRHVDRHRTGPRDWALFVCCPIVDGAFDVGDTTKYVTVPARTPAS